MLIPPPPYTDLPPPSSVVVQQPFEQDTSWRNSSVLSPPAHFPQARNGHKLQGEPASAASVAAEVDLLTFSPASTGLYSNAFLPLSSAPWLEAEALEMDEDWFFKPAPVSRERVTAVVRNIRHGSLRELSLSPLDEDFEE